MYKRQSLAFRQGLTGVLFISPWLIGVTVFFLLPFINTVTYMFGKVTMGSGGVQYTFTGLENIKEVFFRNPDNGRMILENLGSSVGTVLLVLVFSLFAALLLNQKFHGRAVVRALFALPIIVSSGILLSLIHISPVRPEQGHRDHGVFRNQRMSGHQIKGEEWETC